MFLRKKHILVTLKAEEEYQNGLKMTAYKILEHYRDIPSI